MKIVLTGANGFLGWHTRARLHALTDHEVVAVGRDDFADLGDLCVGADALIHIAGINRGLDDDVRTGNKELADGVAAAIGTAGGSPRIIYANSTQCGNGTPYGTGKAEAGITLRSVAQRSGAHFVDVLLPNVFGEHGKPAYNSFVATFVHSVIDGAEPEIVDREVSLLHAQAAAQTLIHALDCADSTLSPAGEPTTVQTVWDKLEGFDSTYRRRDMPALVTQFEVDLFNTFRAALFPKGYPMGLTVHADSRGTLVEAVRVHGGQGQTFVSTTQPGSTRGDHFHLGKIERFVVVSGQARISLRRVLSDEVISFDVSGHAPAAIDMPTMWVHNITNTGPDLLTTLFWTHTLFDPDDPDTYRESVTLESKATT